MVATGASGRIGTSSKKAGEAKELAVALYRKYRSVPGVTAICTPVPLVEVTKEPEVEYSIPEGIAWFVFSLMKSVEIEEGAAGLAGTTRWNTLE